MKLLKLNAGRADNTEGMGSGAGTAELVRPASAGGNKRPWRSRAWIWLTVTGVLLGLAGVLAILAVTGPDGTREGGSDGASTPAAETGGPEPAQARPGPGAPSTTMAVAGPSRPVPPDGSPTPPPASPQEVAEMLASLPLQVEMAATAGGEPREITAEEVDRMVDEMLRQLGAHPDDTP